METGRGLDQLWMVQLLAASKRLVAMAMWQSFSADVAVEAMINAIDQASWAIRPVRQTQSDLKALTTLPVTKKYAQRAIRYDIAALSVPIANLIRPYIKKLTWQRNSNYAGTAFADNYAYCEFIGPGGIAISNNLRIGMMLMAPQTHYPMHSHPAAEIYFVLSGEARFKVPARPWRVCPIGQFVFHDSGVPHEIETRDQHALLLYFWRGDVVTQANLTQTSSLPH